MIHYSCDLCKREISSRKDVRYVVKMEVHPAVETDDEYDDDRDHLNELHELLETMDDVSGEELDQLEARELRFDLCPDCHKKFLKDPLGREAAHAFDFSEN
jgi:uncharacterized protein YlaI